MKQSNLQKIQNNLRNKFLRLGVKMVGPETIHFSKDTKIGKNVTIYQQTTLGGLSPSVDSDSQRNIKRHPTIKDNVIVDQVRRY